MVCRGAPWLLGPLSRVCRTACLPRASQPSLCRAVRLLEPAASAAWCHTLWRMPRRAALSRLRNRRLSGRSASATGYAAQQRGRHGGTDRAPRIVHPPTQCLLRGACPTAPACGHTRSRTKTHPTRAISTVSSVACVQVQPIPSLRSHLRSARSPEPFSNHRKLSDPHRAAHGPARLASHTRMPCMDVLNSWYNRLLFSYIEHRAALQGLTRAAMAVAPPWGVVLLRPGPPGPMPTF